MKKIMHILLIFLVAVGLAFSAFLFLQYRNYKNIESKCKEISSQYLSNYMLLTPHNENNIDKLTNVVINNKEIDSMKYNILDIENKASCVIEGSLTITGYSKLYKKNVSHNIGFKMTIYVNFISEYHPRQYEIDSCDFY